MLKQNLKSDKHENHAAQKLGVFFIISNDIRKMMKAPATANEAISTWKSLSSISPAKKNAIISRKARPVAAKVLRLRPFCLMLMMMGIEPMMSMTANSTMNALAISWKL